MNDQEVCVEDILLEIAFEPIKLQLKRDLEKWNKLKVKRSEAGKRGGLKSGESRSKNSKSEANEANASFVKQNEANEAVTVTVNDNVTVNDILLEKETKEENTTKENQVQEISELVKEAEEVIKQQTEEKRKKVPAKKEKRFGKADFRDILIKNKASPKHVEDWFAVRDKKRAAYTETALEALLKECKNNNFPVGEAVKICAERGWQGFKVKWLDKENQINGNYQKSGNGTGSGSRIAKVSAEELLEQITRDVESGNIPGQY